MSYWIYSSESIPNVEMQKKPGYTPEYIYYLGITLPTVEKKQWMKLPDFFPTTRPKRDWTDRKPDAVEIRTEKFKPVVDKLWAPRGVVMLDHEPNEAEKKAAEKVSEELNLKFRAKAIEFFEQERDSAKARQGKYDVTPYVDECYDILAFPKPYSVDTLKSQRMPGHEAAERIADAIGAAIAQAMAKPAEPAGVRK